MLRLREQNLTADAVLDAVLAFVGGASHPTYEGAYGNDEWQVLRVSFSDRPSVCLRVEHPRHHHDESAASILARADAERRVYERLGAVDFHWSTRLVGASLSFDNPVGYPFLVLDFAGEHRLRWTDDSPPEEQRPPLLARLARIQLQLLQRTLETREMTAYEYYEQRIQRRLQQIRAGNLPEVVEQDVLDQLALLPRVLGDDKDCQQFAMEHGDLRAESIISADQCIIEAIVDWGSAEVVPLVQAARLPPLLWRGSDDDDDDDILLPSAAMLRDRAAYMAATAAAADADDSMAAEAMRSAQTGPRVDFRTLFLESIRSESVLTALAAAAWTLPYEKRYHGEDVDDDTME
ncbi:kinase-like domain [Cordyceps militaris]|uniref:Kinase-like domain n=1 Tax=Cordyceps militaris TaxID=73501 RepID=A0A2H4SFG8_CORMI|nr:kinase-like domain [Cordyceps militaris]